MGVVDQDGVVLAGGGNDLHTALDALDGSQCIGGLLQGDAQLLGDADDGHGVVDGELAGDGYIDGEAVVETTDDFEGNALSMVLRVHAVDVAVAGQGNSDGIVGALLDDIGRIHVVGVDDSLVTALEQDALGGAVLVHGLVEVQMVLGQVGEGSHVEVDAADAVQHQGVGGDLHDHMGAACVTHTGEQGLQLEALGGGALGGDDLVADHVLHGADEADLGAAGLLQDLLQQQGGGGLAVGAGDAHHGHCLSGMTVEVGADEGQSQTVVLHQNVGHIALRLDGGDDDGCALLHCHGDEAVAIGCKAGDGNEHAALGDLTGIVSNVFNVHVHVHIGCDDMDILQKFS